MNATCTFSFPRDNLFKGFRCAELSKMLLLWILEEEKSSILTFKTKSRRDAFH